MFKVITPLETVTPLFLGGSDPRGTPELRPPSFRGALRFWLRALLGAGLGDGALQELREEETKVFGDANLDSGSPVIVRVANSPQPGRFTAPQGVGLRYLLFSMGLRERDPRTGQSTTIWRDCFPPGSSFELILQTRTPGRSQAQEMALRRAGASLWLLVRLGGLGARSRRGGGSLRATADPAGWLELKDMPPLPVKATTPAALRVELTDGLCRLRTATGLPAKGQVRNPPAFDVLHPDGCAIHVTDKTWRTWEEALEALGTAFQGFRNRYTPDYNNVKEVVGGRSQRLESVHRAAFGLPIVFYFRSLGGARGTLEGAEHDRRASPLLIKAVRLANGQYTVVLTHFRAALLDRTERLRLRSRGRPAFAPAPGLDLIDRFMDALSSRGQHYIAPLLEVDYR